VTREAVARWVRAYEEGWRAEDRSAVGRLFTDDATYLRSPYASPLVGHAAIEGFWVDDADDGSVFTMSAEPVAVEGSDAVVRVVVRYGGPAPRATATSGWCGSPATAGWSTSTSGPTGPTSRTPSETRFVP
jgi:ketosteroid isomerase-like protein